MKIPRDAFEVYMRLGDARSYEAVARHFGASKRAVVTRAKRERWQERAAEHDRAAREAAAKKSLESSTATRERQLKVIRTVQGKALDALRTMSLESAIDAVRALHMSLKLEREILGDSSEVTSESLEAVIRAQYERWTQPSKNGSRPAREESHE